MTTHDIIFTHIYRYSYICIIRYAFLWKYTLHATFLWPYTFVIFCTFLRQENLEVRTKQSLKHIFLILRRYVLIKLDFEPLSSSVIRSFSNVIHDCNCMLQNTFLFFSNRKTSDKIKKYSHPLHKTNLHVQDNQKEKISTYFAYSVNLHHYLILFIMFIAQIAVYVIILKERKNTSHEK